MDGESGYGVKAKGRNILLVEEKNEHEALRAYRNGRFFGAILGNGLNYIDIQADENNFYVETNKAEKIRFVSYEINTSQESFKKVEKQFKSNKLEFRTLTNQ